MLERNLLTGAVISATLALTVACGTDGPRGFGGHVEETRTWNGALETTLPWSREPPADLFPEEVPQFVAITYDDNFVPSGMEWTTSYYESLLNPKGNATPGTFDGAPVKTSFYHTSLYIDGGEANLKAWRASFEARHEAADHTRNHSNGTQFSVEQWTKEISDCKNALTNPESGIGAKASDISGFRSPYLGYNQHTFSALKNAGFVYDTSIQNCWANEENGKNCSFPYTLDAGSADADMLTQKFSMPKVDRYAGLWEVPLSALIIPDDALASQYDFEKGLRTRIPGEMPMPSYFEAASGKIAPLDITLFVDARLKAKEVLAILKYNLDLHLSGNRAPLVFVAHTHVYADDYLTPDNAPTAAERREAIAHFTEYALTKPEVRMRPVRDIVAWMKDPVPLTGKRTVDAGVRDAAVEAGNNGLGGTNASGGTSARGGTDSGVDSTKPDAGASVPKRRARKDSTTTTCNVSYSRSNSALSALALLCALALTLRHARKRRSEPFTKR